MNRTKLVVLGAIVIAIIVTMFVWNNESSEPKKELGTPDIKQLVNDYSTGKLQAKSASITSQQLIVTSLSNKKTTYTIPDDEFFVSIAPYIVGTHPCAIHSLTSCVGELAEEEFNVYIEDSKGNVVLDQTLKSLANGFIDLWLPRDDHYLVKITQDGKIAEAKISTFKDDDTCIASMQLM